MSETEYISGMEGMHGDSQVLLDGDVDLSALLPPCGYLVAKFLAPDLIAKMHPATEALVCVTSLTFLGRISDSIVSDCNKNSGLQQIAATTQGHEREKQKCDRCCSMWTGCTYRQTDINFRF